MQNIINLDKKLDCFAVAARNDVAGSIRNIKEFRLCEAKPKQSRQKKHDILIEIPCQARDDESLTNNHKLLDFSLSLIS